MFKMQVIGHRGSAGTSPENTIASVLEGIRAGVSWLEIDIRCVDDELFVIHDETLDRTTDGHGSIYALDKNAIRSVDAGNGEKIPTLHEMLQLIGPDVCLNIELKDRHSLKPAYSVVSALIAARPQWRNKIMFSTFEDSIHAEMAKSLPATCMLGILYEEISDHSVDYALRLNAYSLNLSYAQMKPALINQAHEAGLKVLVYTVNEQEHIKTCKTLGVDGIYTDFPESTLNFLNELDDCNEDSNSTTNKGLP